MRRWPLLAVLAVAACQGGPAPSGAPLASASVLPSATEASPSSSIAAGASASDAVAVADACQFLPPDAAAAALGTEPLTATPTPGDGDFTYCNYTTPDSTSVMATSYTATQGFVFDSYAAGEDVEEVPGVGDAAIFTQGLLMIRQGDEVFSIQAGDTGLADEELLPALEEAARAAAENLGDGDA